MYLHFNSTWNLCFRSSVCIWLSWIIRSPVPRELLYEGSSSQLGHEIITVSQGPTNGRTAVSLDSWSSTACLHLLDVKEMKKIFRCKRTDHCSFRFTQRSNLDDYVLMVFSQTAQANTLFLPLQCLCMLYWDLSFLPIFFSWKRVAGKV